MPEWRRILIVMPNWYGETLFATPFLRALRAALPGASLAVMSVPKCFDVLEHNPALDERIVYDERGIHRRLWMKGRLAQALRARRFDAAVVLRPSLSRTALLALAGIRRRIGFAHAKSGWLLTDRVAPPPPPAHKAATYLALLPTLVENRAGYIAAPGSCAYYPTTQERAWARQFLREQGVADDHTAVFLHPGANWAHKRWPAERFAELANRLQARAGAAIVVTGAPEDGAILEDIRRRMATPPIVLAGRTTFRQFAACLERADLVVTNDTGPVHLAAALGRPVIGLYGPTSPALTGPLGAPQRTVVIHHAGCCPAIPCLQPEHPGFPGMASITVEEVASAAMQILERHKR